MSTVTPPNLGTIVTSASVRKAIYGIYGILAFILAATQVGFASANAGQPVWLTVSLGVAAFVGTAVSGLAVANAQNSASVTVTPVAGAITQQIAPNE